MGFTLDPSDVLDGLEVADRGLGEVLAFCHRVVRECLRLLRLVLALVELRVFEKLPTMRGRNLFGAALVALTTEVLRWLVVFTANFACDGHVVVVRGVVVVRIGWQHLGRLRLLKSSNNFPMPRGTLSIGGSGSSLTHCHFRSVIIILL